MKPVRFVSLQRSAVYVFKIRNRRGYAALCKGNLTEGGTPLVAYQRMQKAVKRMKYCLKDLTSAEAARLVRVN